jgi:hypothetical protein
MQMSFPIAASGTTKDEIVTMDFSHFGVPISIVAPNPSDVASYQTFQAAAQSAGVTPQSDG